MDPLQLVVSDEKQSLAFVSVGLRPELWLSPSDAFVGATLELAPFRDFVASIS